MWGVPYQYPTGCWLGEGILPISNWLLIGGRVGGGSLPMSNWLLVGGGVATVVQLRAGLGRWVEGEEIPIQYPTGCWFGEWAESILQVSNGLLVG